MIDIYKYCNKDLKPDDLKGILKKCEYVTGTNKMFVSEPEHVICSLFGSTEFMCIITFKNDVLNVITLCPVWNEGDWWYTSSQEEADKRWKIIKRLAKKSMGNPDQIYKDGKQWMYRKNNMTIMVIGYPRDFIYGGEIKISFSDVLDFSEDQTKNLGV